jgi:hypothetical protein
MIPEELNLTASAKEIDELEHKVQTLANIEADV